MQSLLNIISGKKSKFVLFVFCIIYALVLGMIWIIKVDPMVKETDLLVKNILSADSTLNSYLKILGCLNVLE